MPKKSTYYYPEDVKQQILQKIQHLEELSPQEREFRLDEYKIMQQRDGVPITEYEKEEFDNLKVSEFKQKQQSKQSKPITIKMPVSLLNKLKAEAHKRGLPYQTFIKSILHQAMNNPQNF